MLSRSIKCTPDRSKSIVSGKKRKTSSKQTLRSKERKQRPDPAREGMALAPPPRALLPFEFLEGRRDALVFLGKPTKLGRLLSSIDTDELACLKSVRR
jgi:hypothetical protein